MENRVSRPDFSTRNALEVAQQHFDKIGEIRELPSERDRNFLIAIESGEEFVLKIANTSEKIEILQLQNSLMEHIATNAGKAICPQPLAAKSGDKIICITAEDGASCFARLVSYLPGEPLAQIRRPSPELLNSFGQIMGIIDRSLSDFLYTAAPTDFYWDLSQAPKTIGDNIDNVEQPDRRAIIEYFLQQYQYQVSPHLPSLRQSFIHNDANDYNVLVSGKQVNDTGVSAKQVTGIIDFGDAVYSHTVNELAVACAYAVMDSENPIAAASHLIAGYHRIFPLSEIEIEVLYNLICMRLSLSVTIAACQKKLNPENEYLTISEKPAWELLERLRRVNPVLAHYTFRHACGLIPCPRSESVIKFLEQYRDEVHPVVKALPLSDRSNIFDLSFTNPDITAANNSGRVNTVGEYVRRQLKTQVTATGIGRYNEIRMQPVIDASNPDINLLHLGTDIFTPGGTQIFSPLDGSVSDIIKDNDFKYTIALKHTVNDGQDVFFTIYRGLADDPASVLQKNEKVSAGDCLGKVGGSDSSSILSEHLHFQLCVSPEISKEDLPPSCDINNGSVWSSICPNPGLILGLLPEASAAPESSPENLFDARAQYIGRMLSISYRQPLKIVKGFRQYLYDQSGRAYLDAVNNVPHVGHCHPYVVRAAQRQMAILNTNTRYLHDTIVNYAERLTRLMPDPLRVCFFVCSGSEANELAIRLARAHTGKEDIIVVDGAYHGNTSALVDISPYKFDGPGGKGAPPSVHKVPVPDTYRGEYKASDKKAGEKYAAHVGEVIENMRSKGQKPAAFFCESILGCAGQVILPANYLKEAYRYVHDAGGVCVADEVQVGFGRAGTHFWAFETQDVVPDIVTLGKPIGNGHPLAAVITTEEIASSFDTGMEYFNTFGGNPVSCEVGMTVLDVIENEHLQANALDVGTYLKDQLSRLVEKYPLVGDVRGLGLFIGIELVLDRHTLEPATAHADYIINRMKERGVLLSTDGPFDNIIKIKPPIVFTKANADYLVDMLDDVLSECG